jgi:tetratricopeptide (TPR) repeat protein
LSDKGLSQEQTDFVKQTAAKCFNEAWDYLDRIDRSSQDDTRMLTLAYASLYNWSLVGTPRNISVSNWQISRTYCALNEPKLALVYAKIALDISEKEKLSEIWPSSLEGMARALAISGDREAARSYLERAKGELASLKLEDPEDQRIFASQIEDTQKLLS